MISTFCALYPPFSLLTISLTAFTFSETTLFTVISAIFVLLFTLDSHGRWKDYKSVLKKNKYTLIGALKHRNSWCLRTLYRSVHPGAGYLYKVLGYKWYHILPDALISLKSPLLKRNFYRQLVFGNETARKKEC